jgi:hypothetical protein
MRIKPELKKRKFKPELRNKKKGSFVCSKLRIWGNKNVKKAHERPTAMADKRMRPPATPTTNSTIISPPACTIPTAGAATTKLLTVLLLLHLHLLPLVLLHLLLFAPEFGKCRSLAMAEEEER